MKAETLNYTMLVLISSIVFVTLVLWEFEKIKHRKAVREGRRKSAGFDDGLDDATDDDPYGVGMNDKDIL
jgi:hypothetical protein